jgi:CRISPR-associated protein Cst2
MGVRKMNENISNEKEENIQEDQGGKYIVMDIVFYAASLNYDQGFGNYQELKKITKWDGKQYTLVSRYALRYSLLKTAEELNYWKNATGKELERVGNKDKTVIQPSLDVLLTGKILTIPEFDLFGYLITSTTPQNSREAPVKISHAISMTPYTYDSHFAGNLGFAKRMVDAGSAEQMDPNLFTIEEHQTYYIYTVVIDVNKIGKDVIYLAIGEKKDEKIDIEYKNEGKIIIKLNGKEIEFDPNIEKSTEKLEKLIKFNFSLRDKEKIKDRILQLIDSILNLKRNIKGRSEDLSPKLLILGLYNKNNYLTFKDKILLKNEYEEIYEEETLKEDNKVQIKRKIIKSNKPVFEIFSGTNNIDVKELDNNEILNKIKSFLNDDKEKKEIILFRASGIDVETKNSDTGEKIQNQ